MKTIQFREWLCNVQILQYANGRIAIELIDAKDGEPVATASINMSEVDLDEDEVIIKNYSENDGILPALVYGEIVVTTGKRVVVGFTTCEICKLIKN